MDKTIDNVTIETKMSDFGSYYRIFLGENGTTVIFVNEFHNGKHRGNIVLHIGYFHVRNCAAGRKLLEFTFKFKFRESVDFFGYVYVIAVGDIALIRNARDNTEALL